MIMRNSRQNLWALLLVFCILPVMTNAWRLFWARDDTEATAAASEAAAHPQGEGTSKFFLLLHILLVSPGGSDDKHA